MADLTSFSNNNFNETDWINKTLEDIPSNETIDSYLSLLIMKLHIMAQDYTEQLETTMIETIANTPKLLNEITRCEDQLKNVNNDISNLSIQLNTFDNRNIVGIEDLSRLDIIKNNMEKCKGTLEEHARWNQLVREAKNLLEGGGRLSDSADRIETMFHSLAVLKNLPGHAERQSTCESFKNSLLTALRPIVRRDVANLDSAPLKEYLHVFTKLGCEIEMTSEYIKARPDSIKNYWTENINSNNNLEKVLSNYLNQIVNLLATEEEKTKELFTIDKSPDILCNILIEALQPMTQTLSEKLRTINNPIIIINCYNILNNFSNKIIKYLCLSSDIKYSEVLSTIYNSLYITDNNNNDISYYINSECSLVKEELLTIIIKIVFNIDNNNSNDIDEELFSNNNNNIYTSYSENLLTAVEDFVPIISNAVVRGIAINGGIQCKSILRGLATVFASYVKYLTSKIDDLSFASGFERDAILTDNNNNTSTVMEGNLLHILKNQSNHSELLAKKVETGDVESGTLIVAALRALQSVGRFVKNFAQLEDTTKELLSEVHARLSQLPPPTTSTKGVTILMNSIKEIINADTTNSSNNIGTIYASYYLQNNNEAYTELNSYLLASSSQSLHLSQHIFSLVEAPLQTMRDKVSLLLYKLCISAPEKMLSELASDSDVWAANNTSSIDELKENMLPQSVVTQVGEHLLTLVQELESFATTDALNDLLLMKKDAENQTISSSGWQRLKTLLEIKTDDELQNICKRNKCARVLATIETTLFGSSSAALTLAEGTAEDHTDNNNVILDLHKILLDYNKLQEQISTNSSSDIHSAHVLLFVNEWLSSIADGVVGLLLSQIITIPVLTTAGCAQLIIDLEYFNNVMNAMSLPSHPTIAHIKVILEQPPKTLIKSIDIMAPGKLKGATGNILKLDHFLIEAIGKGHGLL